MSLGLVCHWLDESDKNLLSASELRLNRLRSGLYSESHIRNTYINNVVKHIKVMPLIIASGIKAMRLTSSLFSLCDQVPRDWWDNDIIRGHLATLGNICLAANVRITMHPGQFVVLSSDEERVVNNAIVELETHAWILDAMGLPRTPYHAINIHGGKRDRIDSLCRAIDRLNDSARNRLTLENDESSYNVPQLLQVFLKTGVPVLLDTHHFSFNTGDIDLDLAHQATCDTWKAYGIKPLQHISNTEIGLENGSFMDRRKHSSYIHTVPDVQLRALRADEIDVEVESKQKNRAVFRMSKEFDIPL